MTEQHQNQLARIDPSQVTLRQEEMPITELALNLAKSGFFADARDQSQAIVKVLAGRELGIAPIRSMANIHIVKGKTCIGASIMAELIRKSGRYNYRIVTLTNEECSLSFTEDGQEVFVSTFTMADAQKTGNVKPDSAWMTVPRNMLFARALSNGARWVCPEVLGGATYTPEEMGVRVDERGDAIEGEFTVEGKPSPAEIVATASARMDEKLAEAKANATLTTEQAKAVGDRAKAIWRNEDKAVNKADFNAFVKEITGKVYKDVRAGDFNGLLTALDAKIQMMLENDSAIEGEIVNE